MSQDDIIKILESKKEPLTSKELSEYLDITIENIRRTLKKLVEHKEVKARPLTSEERTSKGYNNIKNVNNRTKVFWIED